MNPQYYGAAAEYNKPKGSKFLNPKVLIIAGGILVGLLVLMVILAVISSVASGPRNDLARLAVRTQQLADFIELNAKGVSDPDLAKIASETRLFVSTNSLAVSKAYGGELPDGVIASEADSTSKADLDAAFKAGKYDEEFLEIMTEKVNSTLELSQKIQSQNSGPQTKAAAEETTSSLKVVSEQLVALKL